MASPRNHNGSVVGADDGRETCPSADDSDSTKPHSREPGDDVDEWRRPLLHTAAFCYAYFVLGWLVSQRGAVHLDLLLVTGTEVPLGSLLLTLAGLGSIAGVLAGGFLLDLTRKPVLLVAGALLLNVALNIVIPLCTVFPVMGCLYFTAHFAMSGIDVVVNSEVARLWGNGGRSYMQGLHFSFSLGAVVSPLAMQPFLAPKARGHSDPWKLGRPNRTLNLSENGSEMDHLRNDMEGFRNSNSSRFNVFSQSHVSRTNESFMFSNQSLHMGPVDENPGDLHILTETRVFYALILSAVLCLSAALLVLVLRFYPVSNAADPKQINGKEDRKVIKQDAEPKIIKNGGKVEITKQDGKDKVIEQDGAMEVGKEYEKVKLTEEDGKMEITTEDGKVTVSTENGKVAVAKKNGKVKVIEGGRKLTATKQNRDVTRRRVAGVRLLALALVSAYYFLSSYVSCPDYLMTFVVQGLDWGKSSGARLISVYWVGMTAGRLSGVGLVRLLTPARILFAALGLLLLSFLTLLLATLLHVHWVVWLSSAAVGFFVAFLFPTIISYTNESIMLITGRLAALLFTLSMSASMLDPLVLAQLMALFDHTVYIYFFFAKTSLALLCFGLLHSLVTSRLPTTRCPSEWEVEVKEDQYQYYNGTDEAEEPFFGSEHSGSQ